MGLTYMCYKEEKHRQLSINLTEKLKNVPLFIADFFDRYKSAATKNCNWGYIRDLLQWLIERKYIIKKSISDITPNDMDAVTSNHIIKYLNDLKDGITCRKNLLDSICTKKNVFSAFWNYMFLNKYVSDNIIRHIPGHLYKSEITQKEVKIPTDNQVRDFLDNIDNEKSGEFTIMRNTAIVKLILGSGIRSEELINLDVEDLHLNVKRPYIMVLGKGNIEQKDKVFISLQAMDYMREYMKKRRKFLADKFETEKAVFISERMGRLSKTPITSFFDRYSHGEINPHMLRHWVGSELYKNTKDIVLVQRQLRHKDLETAAKYYVHIDESVIADSMAEMRVS